MDEFKTMFLGVCIVVGSILLHVYLNEIAVFEVTRQITFMWTTPTLLLTSIIGLLLMIPYTLVRDEKPKKKPKKENKA